MKKYLCIVFLFILPISVSFAQTKGDVDSYKGVPWGADFERFKELKNYEGTRGETTNELLKGYLDSYNWSNCLAVILGAPVYTENLFGHKMMEVELKHVPEKFYSVYIEKDDVRYIFYDGKFAMAFSTLYAKNYDEIYNSLSKKYKVSNTISKEVMTKGVPPKHDIVSISYTPFIGGNTNVYLIKRKYSTPSWGIGSTSVGILYISAKYDKLIKSEIERSKAEEKRGKRNKDKKDLGSDLDKIE